VANAGKTLCCCLGMEGEYTLQVLGCTSSEGKMSTLNRLESKDYE
jgi:hypothetical protein